MGSYMIKQTLLHSDDITPNSPFNFEQEYIEIYSKVQFLIQIYSQNWYLF